MKVRVKEYEKNVEKTVNNIRSPESLPNLHSLGAVPLTLPPLPRMKAGGE